MLKASIASRILRIARDQRGVSAVEFALLAPIMIGLYLGCVEISDAVSVDRKVSLTAAALANLTAQVSPVPPSAIPTISTSDMNNILDASSAIIAPYSAGNLKMTVSCLKIDANKNATVKWSVTRNGTARPVGTYTFASSNAALAVANSWLILSEVSYAYTPTVGYTITGTLTLPDKMFMSPRNSAPTYGILACS